MDEIKESLCTDFQSIPIPLPMEVGARLETDMAKACTEMKRASLDILTGIETRNAELDRYAAAKRSS